MYSPQSEEKWVSFWKEKKSFEKSVEQRPESAHYTFYDGPPFATGMPHWGNLLGLTIKDVFPRYHTMRGKHVERKWGWDCHGLPIENKVEKKLDIRNKKQIEEMGISVFNRACRDLVLEYAHDWKKTIDRMGKWIEYDNAYQTMDQSYMESIWWSFKTLYEKGHIYEGKKILMYCPRCQTPLAKAEIQMDNSYKDVKEAAVFVKFKLKGEDNTFLLAWTTTPWTLIGNAALAVNEKLEYVKIKSTKTEEQYILAKSLVKILTEEYTIIDTFKGEKILHAEYEPLYQLDMQGKKGHYVVAGGDGVSSEEGTGIVHIAAYGEFDYDLVRKYDLPLFTHVGENGLIREGHEEWHGKWFKKVDPHIIEDLEKRGLLYKKEDHTHSYPFCYRCDTPLFYNPVNSWFVRIQNVKEKLLEKNQDIKWFPEGEGKARFVNIIETAPDWNISRNRFWATAIPVWKCSDCNNMRIVGSIKELQEHALEKVPDDVDLHKDSVDEIHLKCTCGKTMTRIPEVIDCWFESGAMPYASKHYPFENKEWFKDHYPGDFVSEYVGQVRAWFYYMHVLGVLLFDKAPFSNVAVSGNILAADGNKMSKSRNNFTDPSLLFEKYGADAARYYMMQSPVTQAQDMNFRDEGVQEVYRKVILLLANTLSFYEMYAGENDKLNNPHSPDVLDQWVVTLLNQSIETITTAMDAYDTVTACRVISRFTTDLSTWYLRRSRDRLKGSDALAKQNAIQTLAYVLHEFSKAIAPIAPFIAEEIHQVLRKNNSELKESVHLEDWPLTTEKMDEKILHQMKELRDAVGMALEQRESQKIPVRQPLNKVTLFGFSFDENHCAIFMDEVNVKHVSLEKSKNEGEFSIELDTILTPELLSEGAAREFIRFVQDLRKTAKTNPTDEIVLAVEATPHFEKMLAPHLNDIKAKVRAAQIIFETPKKSLFSSTATIKEENITIFLTRVGL